MSAAARSERHQPGPGRLCYSPDGALLYTTGADGFLRVFSARPEDDNNEQIALIEYHEEPVFSIDASMESVVTGCEDSRAALFDHGTKEFTGLVTESSMGLAVRSVKFSPNGQRVAVASDELEVKIIDVRDIKKLQTLEGHKKGVRAVTWSPEGQLLTTSGCDGTIRVWDVSDPNAQEPTCIRVIEDLIAAEEAGSETQCAAVWHPSGRYFVVGTKGHDIAVVSRETWEREGQFEQEGHTGAITTLHFSPNGRYLCSTAEDKAVLVWDCTSRRIVQRLEDAQARVSDLAWRFGAGSNSIAFIDNLGYVSRWHGVIPSELAHPNDAPQISNRANGVAGSKGKSSAHDLEDDDLNLGFGDVAAGEAPLGDEDDFIEDDDDDGIYQSRYNRKGDDDELPPPISARNRTGIVVATSSGSGRNSSLVKGQAPFQPGATPSKDRRRYFAFNSIGVIHVVERESHNIVQVEFHDQSTHTSSQFDDFTKFDIGCLGHRGAAYAHSSRAAGSSVSYRPFEAWGSSSGEWQVELPAGEEVTVLALGGSAGPATADDADGLDGEGSGKIVAATSKNYLRIFSGTGRQAYLMNLGEQIVTMAAGSEWVIVVHRPHDLITPGWQNLGYTILDLDTYEVIQRGMLPLPKNATLAWVGFSENQIPFIYDNDGVLSALDKARRPMQARWVPMLDTNTLARREGKQESYWPIGANDASLMCVILKGGERYPYFPVPITSDLPIQMPVLRLGDPMGELEAKYLQSTFLAGNARDSLPPLSMQYTEQYQQAKAKTAAYDVDIDKSLLKLLQQACKNDKHQQGFELAKMLSSNTALGGAVKIANLYSMTGLAQRLEVMLDERTGAGKSRHEQEKRDGKYAHLVDLRTIPNSTLQLGGKTTGGQARSTNPLSVPFSPSTKPRKTAKNVFSDAPKAAPVQRHSTVVAVNGDQSDDEPMHYDDERSQGERTRTESVMPDSGTPMSSMPVRAPFNPFAKSAQVSRPSSTATTVASSQAGPSNPFAKKPSQLGSNALKKTGSFFDRVDAGSVGVASATKAQLAPTASKQSTLFGLPGAKEGTDNKKPSNRGRKRKSDANGDSQGGEEDEVEVTTVRKQPKSLKSFFGGKNAKASGKDKPSGSQSHSEREDSVMEVQGDTTEQAEPSGSGDENVESEVPAMENSTSGESIEHDAAEPITPSAEEAEHEAILEEEETAPASPAKQTSASKLAAFRYEAAPTAAVADVDADA